MLRIINRSHTFNNRIEFKKGIPRFQDRSLDNHRFRFIWTIGQSSSHHHLLTNLQFEMTIIFRKRIGMKDTIQELFSRHCFHSSSLSSTAPSSRYFARFRIYMADNDFLLDKYFYQLSLLVSCDTSPMCAQIYIMFFPTKLYIQKCASHGRLYRVFIEENWLYCWRY